MFNWNEYYSFAQELMERDNELGYRCAISRAYYAVYNLAKNWLITTSDHDKRITIPKEQHPHHSWVWNEFKNYGGMYTARIANSGNRLKVVRNKADYDAEFEQIKETAERFIHEAKKIIDDITRIS